MTHLGLASPLQFVNLHSTVVIDVPQLMVTAFSVNCLGKH